MVHGQEQKKAGENLAEVQELGLKVQLRPACDKYWKIHGMLAVGEKRR